MIYRRGGAIWWYEFEFNGRRVRGSAHTRNKEIARQIEAAHKIRLAKGEAGIAERPPAPTLKESEARFHKTIETLCAAKPATIRFYREKLRRLLEFEPLAAARLNEIDESAINAFQEARTRQLSRYRRYVAPASVNRELATLRRLLRIARDEWKLIDRVPRIRLLPGERNRDFVLSFEQEKIYLEMARQPLRDIAILLLDTGLRLGEALRLEWRDVHLEDSWVRVREGKSRYAQRNVSLTARARAMLQARRRAAGLVFADSAGNPLLATSLDHQHSAVRRLLKLPADFVLHSLRHTMLTRLGQAGADAFTIMRLAGHSSVTVSQRYVHPCPEVLQRAIERLDELNRKQGPPGSPQNPPQYPKSGKRKNTISHLV